MTPTDQTRFGDPVRRKRDGRRVRLGTMSDVDNPSVIWDDCPDVQILCEWDDLEPLPRGPGIGAVVAMVAAARMVRGGWSSRPWARGDGVTHWDFVAPWMTHAAISACGRYRHGDYGFAADLDDVDCPDCLAIARRAGVLHD